MRAPPAAARRRLRAEDASIGSGARAAAWLGEVEGLKVSPACIDDKLVQIGAGLRRQATTIQLRMPAAGVLAG